MNKCLSKLHAALEQIKETNVNVRLYRFNRTGSDMKCSTYTVDLPVKSVKEYVDTLADDCRKDMEEFDDVLEYNETYFEEKLSWIDLRDAKISAVWKAIAEANCDCEQEWVRNYRQDKAQHKFKGVVVESVVDGKPIMLFMVANPVKCVDNAFILSKNEFKEVDGPLLILPTKVGAVLFGGRIYFMSRACLKLFVSKDVVERESRKAVDVIVAKGRIADEASFRDFAGRGHNPRRLLKCDENKVAIISDPKLGKVLRKKFGIEMKGGKIMTSSQDETDRLIKVVTNRGMVDPFDNDAAVEVTGAVKWGGGNEK